MSESEVMRCLVQACSPESMSVPLFLTWSYISLSVRFFTVSAIGYAALWQDVPTAVALFGGLLVTGFCHLLKGIIAHERQYPACGWGHAMPSFHAMYTSYFSVYYSLCFYRYSQWSYSQLAYRIVATLSYAALVCASRVQLGAGDTLEVMVGAILGLTVALILLHLQTLFSKYSIPGGKED